MGEVNDLLEKFGFSGMKRQLKDKGYSDDQIKHNFKKALKKDLSTKEKVILGLCFLALLAFILFLSLLNELLD